jgi:hypothetical protein
MDRNAIYNQGLTLADDAQFLFIVCSVITAVAEPRNVIHNQCNLK